MSTPTERAHARCMELLKDRITTHYRKENIPVRGGFISSPVKCREWGRNGRRASPFTGRGIAKRNPK